MVKKIIGVAVIALLGNIGINVTAGENILSSFHVNSVQCDTVSIKVEGNKNMKLVSDKCEFIQNELNQIVVKAKESAMPYCDICNVNHEEGIHNLNYCGTCDTNHINGNHVVNHSRKSSGTRHRSKERHH